MCLQQSFQRGSLSLGKCSHLQLPCEAYLRSMERKGEGLSSLAMAAPPPLALTPQYPPTNPPSSMHGSQDSGSQAKHGSCCAELCGTCGSRLILFSSLSSKKLRVQGSFPSGFPRMIFTRICEAQASCRSHLPTLQGKILRHIIWKPYQL